MGAFLNFVAQTIRSDGNSNGRLQRFLTTTGRVLRSPERLRQGINHRQAPPLSDRYPGDFTGRPDITYAPRRDSDPDPGEVVWAWVPFEEDHSQGKDRPVLVIARDGQWLVAVPLTSKDHHRDAAQEAREGRFWVDLGVGKWDEKRRPSEVRVDRMVRINPAAVRRTGVGLDRARFDRVTRAVLENAWR